MLKRVIKKKHCRGGKPQDRGTWILGLKEKRSGRQMGRKLVRGKIWWEILGQQKDEEQNGTQSSMYWVGKKEGK